METSSLTYKTLKNVMYSVIGYVWPMFFSIFVTPVIIFHLGIKNYGIYLFINSIVALLGILEFGISTAIVKHFAFYYGKKDEAALKTLIRTANSLVFVIGLVGLGISVGIEFIGPHLMPNQFASYAQYMSLFLIGGGIFFMNCLFSVYGMILIALQRFDLSNKIGVISITVSSLSMLFLVLAGGSIKSIFILQFLISTVFGYITYRAVKKILPWAGLKYEWNRPEIKKCYKFSIVASINNVANSALSSLDRLIIPFYVGPSNLTFYSVPGNITNKIPGIANTLSTMIFPMTSQLDGGGETARIEALYIRSFRLITIIAAATTITTITYSHKILLFWLNADFANHSSTVLVILAATCFIIALFGPLSNFLLGLGKLKFLTTMSVGMGVLNAVLLLVLLPRYGIIGAAWAYFFSVLPVTYMFFYTEKHYLSLVNRKNYYKRKIVGTLVTSAIVWLLGTFVLSQFVVSLATLILVGLASVIFYILVYKIFGFFEGEDWKDLELFFETIQTKIIRGKNK